MAPGCPCRVTLAACGPLEVLRRGSRDRRGRCLFLHRSGSARKYSQHVVPANQQGGKNRKRRKGWLHALSGPALSTGGTRQVITGTLWVGGKDRAPWFWVYRWFRGGWAADVTTGWSILCRHDFEDDGCFGCPVLSAGPGCLGGSVLLDTGGKGRTQRRLGARAGLPLLLADHRERFFVEEVIINADDAVFSIDPEVRGSTTLSMCGPSQPARR